MKFFLVEEITNRVVKDLTNRMQNADWSDDHELYITGTGGDRNAAMILLSFLDGKKDNLEIIAYGSICTSTLNIFMRAQARKRINQFTLCRFTPDVQPGPKDDDFQMLDYWLNLSDDEIEAYWSGREIAFTDTRVLECIEKQISEKYFVE